MASGYDNARIKIPDEGSQFLSANEQNRQNSAQGNRPSLESIFGPRVKRPSKDERPSLESIFGTSAKDNRPSLESIFSDSSAPDLESAGKEVGDIGQAFYHGLKKEIPLVSLLPSDVRPTPYGIIPIGTKEDVNLLKEHPYAEAVGHFAGIAGTMLATAPLEGAIAAGPLMQRLVSLKATTASAKFANYVARTIPRAIHFGTTGFITSAASNASDLASGKIDVPTAASNIAKSTAELAAFAIPASLSHAAVRIGAEGLFGFSAAKLHGHTTLQSVVEGALQMGLGFIDRSNLSETQKNLEFRRISAQVLEASVKKSAMEYEIGLNHSEAMLQQFPTIKHVFNELKQLRDDGRIIDVSDDEIHSVAEKVWDIWGKQMSHSKTSSGFRPTLLSPSEMVGARPHGEPLDFDMPEPISEAPATLPHDIELAKISRELEAEFGKAPPPTPESSRRPVSEEASMSMKEYEKGYQASKKAMESKLAELKKQGVKTELKRGEPRTVEELQTETEKELLKDQGEGEKELKNHLDELDKQYAERKRIEEASKPAQTKFRARAVKPSPVEKPQTQQVIPVVSIPGKGKEPPKPIRLKKPGHNHTPETVRELGSRGYTANEVKKASPETAKLIIDNNYTKQEAKILPNGTLEIKHNIAPQVTVPQQAPSAPEEGTTQTINVGSGAPGGLVKKEIVNPVTPEKPGAPQKPGPVLGWLKEGKTIRAKTGSMKQFAGKPFSERTINKIINMAVGRAMRSSRQKYNKHDHEDAAIEVFVRLSTRQPRENVKDREAYIHSAINEIANNVAQEMSVNPIMEQSARSKKAISMASKLEAERKLSEAQKATEEPAQPPKGLTWQKIIIAADKVKALGVNSKSPNALQSIVAILSEEFGIDIKPYHLAEIFEAMGDAESIRTTNLDAIIEKKKKDIDDEEAEKGTAYDETADEEVSVEEDMMAKLKSLPGDLPQIPSTLGPSAIEMPELMNLYQKLLGEAPVIVEKLVGKWGYHKHGKVTLHGDAFKSPQFALYLLGHELGHLTNWLQGVPAFASLRMRLMVLQEGIEKAFGPLEPMAEKLYADAGVTIKNENLVKELKDWTMFYNPFDELRDKKYTAYRYMPKELYAEFFSGLLNHPEELARRAPNAWNLFFEHMHKHPTFARTYLELQDFLLLGKEDKHEIREERQRNAYLKDDEIALKRRKEIARRKKSFKFHFTKLFIDRNYAVIEKIERLIASGVKIKPDDDPRTFFSMQSFNGGINLNTVGDIDSQVLQPLLNLNMRWEKSEISKLLLIGDMKYTNDMTEILHDVSSHLDWAILNLGLYNQMNWIIQGRSDVANPGGHTARTATDFLNGMRNKLGDDVFLKIGESAKAFRAIVEAHLQRAFDAGLYSKQQFDRMMLLTAYAPFQTLKHANEYVSSKMIAIVGTLDDIRNPFIVQVERLINLNNAIARQYEKRTTVEMLKKTPVEDQEIEPAEMMFIRGVPTAKPRPGWGIISCYEQGVMKFYYCDPYIEDQIKYSSTKQNNGVTAFFHWANTSWFRPILTGWNIRFQGVHFTRQFLTTLKKIPYATLGEVIAGMRKSFPLAKDYIWGKLTPQIIYDMRQSGMMGIPFASLFKLEDNSEESQMEFLLRKYNGFKNRDLSKKPGKLSFLTKPFTSILDFFEDLGNFFETHNRLMFYFIEKAAQGKSGLSDTEIANKVRWYGGSSSRVASGTALSWSNNLSLFFNDAVQGTRGDWLAGTDPKTRRGYWWRTFLINILPTFLKWMAYTGLFGATLKMYMRKISDYRLKSYHCIPLWYNKEEGKVLAFQMPQDVYGRILSGTIWEMLNFAPNRAFESIQNVLKEAKEFLPINPAPIINIPYIWIAYFTGGVPYDFRSMQPVLNKEDMRAGIKYSLPKMINATIGMTGLYAFTDKKPARSPLAFIIKWIPIVNLFLVYTNAGDSNNPAIKEYLRQKAIKSEERSKSSRGAIVY